MLLRPDAGFLFKMQTFEAISQTVREASTATDWILLKARDWTVVHMCVGATIRSQLIKKMIKC